MTKYGRFDSIVPRGSGQCASCRGTGKTGSSGYSVCWSCDGTGKCHHCDGTGLVSKQTDQDVHHCVHCSDNHERFRELREKSVFWLNKLIYGDDYVKYL